jgi:hypothetical protein
VLHGPPQALDEDVVRHDDRMGQRRDAVLDVLAREDRDNARSLAGGFRVDRDDLGMGVAWLERT